jgi:RNA polymerase sigma-70 factor (ECF subfamily)
MTAEAPLLESPARTPEDRVGERELAGVLEAALDSLAPPFRSVFMLREVEGLSTDETAECLDIPAETVKTRLHRARGHLRQSLEARLGDAASLAFQFGAARCDRIVAGVLGRIGDAPR